MSLELFESIINDLYEFAIQPRFSEELKRAEKIFVLNEDQSDTEGFAEWFIFNYRLTQQNKRLIDAFHYTANETEEKTAALAAIKNSRRSIFELKTERDHRVVKDIFTNEDFSLTHELIEEDQLISARLITLDHQHYLMGDIFTIETEFKDSLKKYVMDQYNQYCINVARVSWPEFLDINAQLLYKVMEILEHVEEENAFEHELMLHQATYAFLCTSDALHENFLKIGLPIFADEDDEPILRVMDGDLIIAEIEITNGQFYVLCNNESHLNQMIVLLEPLLSSEIAFLKTEQFALEDLL